MKGIRVDLNEQEREALKKYIMSEVRLKQQSNAPCHVSVPKRRGDKSE